MFDAGGRGRSKTLADFFVGLGDVSNGEVILFENFIYLFIETVVDEISLEKDQVAILVFPVGGGLF